MGRKKARKSKMKKVKRGKRKNQKRGGASILDWLIAHEAKPSQRGGSFMDMMVKQADPSTNMARYFLAKRRRMYKRT